jgi:hypothetical protein
MRHEKEREGTRVGGLKWHTPSSRPEISAMKVRVDEKPIRRSPSIFSGAEGDSNGGLVDGR